MRTVFFNDKERFEYLATKLPQFRIKEVGEQLLSTGWISETNLEMFLEHLEGTMELVFFTFDDKRIQTAYDKFNKAFQELDEYIADHFSYFREVYELYPTQKRGDREQREFYYTHRAQLTLLAESFGRAYVELLRAGMNSISPQSSRITIHLDREKGVYIKRKDKTIRYPHVKDTSKIFVALIHLRENGESTLASLAGVTGQKQKTIKRGIQDFNVNAKRLFKLPAVPIIGDGIYELNPAFDFF